MMGEYLILLLKNKDGLIEPINNILVNKSIFKKDSFETNFEFLADLKSYAPERILKIINLTIKNNNEIVLYPAKIASNKNDIENKNHLFLRIDDQCEVKSYHENLEYNDILFNQDFFDEDSKKFITTYVLEIYNDKNLLE